LGQATLEILWASKIDAEIRWPSEIRPEPAKWLFEPTMVTPLYGGKAFDSPRVAVAFCRMISAPNSRAAPPVA
jgi:hypothetical protein